MKINNIQSKLYQHSGQKKCAEANAFSDKKISSTNLLLQNYFYPPCHISFGDTKDINTVGSKFKDKIKIVFTDIDGTISPHSDIMSEKTISLINNLNTKNIPIILTTARCYKDTLPIIEQLSHSPDYTIILQGGGIVDKNGKEIVKNCISADSGKK